MDGEHLFIKLLRVICIIAGLVVMWQVIVRVTGVPAYILPDPLRVLKAGLSHLSSLFSHALITFFEIVAGLFIGTVFGAAS